MLQNLRLIISLHLKKERKDDMPKKHDPQWGRQKRWRTKEVRPKKMKEKRWRTKEVRPKKMENQSRRRVVIHLVPQSDQ
jgi:hypothetical protein